MTQYDSMFQFLVLFLFISNMYCRLHRLVVRRSDFRIRHSTSSLIFSSISHNNCNASQPQNNRQRTLPGLPRFHCACCVVHRNRQPSLSAYQVSANVLEKCELLESETTIMASLKPTQQNKSCTEPDPQNTI